MTAKETGSQEGLSVPEIRGHKPIPADRTDAYSAASYSALYGITIEDAEELKASYGNSHRDIHRTIMRMFSEDELLKERCLFPEREERRREEARRAEVERERAEKRRERIEKDKHEREAREKAKASLKKEREEEEAKT